MEAVVTSVSYCTRIIYLYQGQAHVAIEIASYQIALRPYSATTRLASAVIVAVSSRMQQRK